MITPLCYKNDPDDDLRPKRRKFVREASRPLSEALEAAENGLTPRQRRAETMALLDGKTYGCCPKGNGFEGSPTIGCIFKAKKEVTNDN